MPRLFAFGFQWRRVRDFDVHKADEPIRRQKENRGENNEQETAVEKHQTERNQKSRREDQCADAPLLCARVEACVGRLGDSQTAVPTE